MLGISCLKITSSQWPTKGKKAKRVQRVI
jgi:hypothetical protein